MDQYPEQTTKDLVLYTRQRLMESGVLRAGQLLHRSSLIGK